MDPKTEFKQIIERIEYPEDTKVVREAVRTHGSGDGVVALADSLPHKTFQSAAEVLEALG